MICSYCKGPLPSDPTDIWFGESGRLYCSEDCMVEACDSPAE